MTTRLLVSAALSAALISPIPAAAQAPTPPPVETPSPNPAPSTDEPPVTNGNVPEADEAPMPSSDPVVRGVSWDLIGGGIPASGALVEVGFGFTGLPRAAYHYSLDRELSIGGLVAFDYGYWAPSIAFRSALILAVPIRYTLIRNETLSIGLRGEPGLYFGFSPVAVGILANVGGSIAFTVENRFMVGGGIDVPLALFIPTSGKVNLSAPILIGPMAEFHVTPPLAITLDAKVGPHLNTAGTTVFALRVMAGFVYRL